MDDPAAPAELVARLPKGVSAEEFSDARPAVQGLILARATVVSADDLAAIQLPPPPADVCVSLPKGVTSADFAGASAQLQHIIKAAASVTRKRERSEDIGRMVAHSAVCLQDRVFSGGGPENNAFHEGMVAAVCNDSVRGQALAAKQPARSVGVLPQLRAVVVVAQLCWSCTCALPWCFRALFLLASLKTKKDIDKAILAATAIAKEIDGVRLKRQRFPDDDLLRLLTGATADALTTTLRETSRLEPDFQRLKQSSRHALATVLMESGAAERKQRYRSDSCAYNALAACEALCALARREYALSETLLALTTALRSPTTQATINSDLKMSEPAVASLTVLCEGMRGPSSTTAAIPDAVAHEGLPDDDVGAAET
jgi:hypothetical protein